MHAPTAPMLSAVKRSVCPAGPEMGAVASHWPPPLADRSNDRKPEKESAVAKPLMAPCQSDVELIHAPSTQLPLCTTVTVIVRVAKFAVSKVPVHVPDMSANTPVVLAGEGADVDEPHALLTHATSAAQRSNVRLTVTDYCVLTS